MILFIVAYGLIGIVCMILVSRVFFNDPPIDLDGDSGNYPIYALLGMVFLLIGSIWPIVGLLLVFGLLGKFLEWLSKKH